MKIKVAASQMTCGWEIKDNLSKAINLINQAAKKGANIIWIFSVNEQKFTKILEKIDAPENLVQIWPKIDALEKKSQIWRKIVDLRFGRNF